jgi:hypothetical protein
MDFDTDQLSYTPLFPAFQNLRSLDVRHISGNLLTLSRDIVMFLIGSSHIRLLGLELNPSTAREYKYGYFLVGVVRNFKHFRERNGTPNHRLEI